MTRRGALGLAALVAVAVVAALAARSAKVDAALSHPSGKIAFYLRIPDKHDAYRIVVMSADGSGQIVLPRGQT